MDNWVVSGGDLAWRIGQRLELFYEDTENDMVNFDFHEVQ